MNLTYNKFFTEVIQYLLANEDTSICSCIHCWHTFIYLFASQYYKMCFNLFYFSVLNVNVCTFSNVIQHSWTVLSIFYIISRAQLWREECIMWTFFSRILCWEFWRFVRLVFLCVWRVFTVIISAILRFLTCFRTLTIGFGFASYFDNRFLTPFCFWRSILTLFGLSVSTLFCFWPTASDLLGLVDSSATDLPPHPWKWERLVFYQCV